MSLAPTRHLPILATAVVLALALTIGALRYEHFASWNVFRNLLVDNAFLGVAAVGATFVILSGGIDLSVGSVVAFTSILIASLVEHRGQHALVAIAVALAFGVGFGAAQGALIHAFRLPAFLVTLAGMFLVRGLGFVIHPQSLGIRDPFIAETLNESASFTLALGPRGIAIPLTVDIFLLAVATAAVVLNFTRFGRAVYAVGDDEHSALLMGLPVARTRVGVYAVAGLCSALAGVVFTLYQQSGDPASCKGFELDAIAAVVMGGTLLRGGVGSVLGSTLGVLLFGVIQMFITFEGTLSSWWTRIVVGAFVLVFLMIQRALLASTQRA
ncbi:MAG: Inner membrane ABC transporter permease protein YjfF [Phycisphaerae bacterium]|nr:Inner membrane ABC transporter permease protein YjfF [Phycisphaerae bacterium]